MMFEVSEVLEVRKKHENSFQQQQQHECACEIPEQHDVILQKCPWTGGDGEACTTS